MDKETKQVLNTRRLTLLIAILVVSNIITGYLYLTEKDVSNEFVNKYPLIDISRNFIDQENFIVNLVPLRYELEEIARDNSDKMKMSMYIEFLNTGANININIDEPIWPASLIKIPVVMAAAKKVENGVWDWDSQLTLSDQDKDSRFGTLYQKPSGTKFTIEELVSESMINSDQTAHLLLARNIDLDIFNQVGEDVGIDLFDQDKKIRVKDYARIMRALYVSSFLKRENSEKILEYLASSSTNDYLSQGMPNGTKFAHKLARNRDQKVFGDAGIVYLPSRPYLINVMVEVKSLDDEEKAIEILKEVSQKTYSYMSI